MSTAVSTDSADPAAAGEKHGDVAAPWPGYGRGPGAVWSDPTAGGSTGMAWLVQRRVPLLAAGHAAIFAVAYWSAFLLRFDFHIPENYLLRMWVMLPGVLAIKLYIFFSAGHFHGWWRYVTFADLTALLRASLLSLLALIVLNHYGWDGQLPRAVVILDSLVSLLLLGALRSSWRLCRQHEWFGQRKPRVALMVGADHENGVLAHQIHAHEQLPYRVVGFLDDSPHRQGTRLGGMPVLGPLRDVVRLAQACQASDILVMDGYLPGREVRRLMADCDAGGLHVKIVPSVVGHLNGRRTIPVRDLDIHDLLGRAPVLLDMASISQALHGKTVLVTGAGGSIGAEICRQLLPFGPARLLLVDYGENALFLTHGELSQQRGQTVLEPLVVDILDEPRLRAVFRQSAPQVVIHAAAHKHVGLMEQNVAQCVRNNVFGTQQVADLAHEFRAEKFVLISTDKAVHPTSVMGASKQLAERYVHSRAQQSPTAFMVVRFGNVLDSNGSVVPIFREQIRRGGPITVTDERMTRFFMTIPEASQLVLQAAAMGRGGEIFVLEMGQQIRIADLARDMIRLSGLPPDAIEIQYVGIRPGEKLYEELYFEDEQLLETAHPKLRAAYHRPHDPDLIQASLDRLQGCLHQPDAVVRAALQQLLPEFRAPRRRPTTVPPVPAVPAVAAFPSATEGRTVLAAPAPGHLCVLPHLRDD